MKNINSFGYLLLTLGVLASGCSSNNSSNTSAGLDDQISNIYEVSNLSVGSTSVSPDQVDMIMTDAIKRDDSRVITLKNSGTVAFSLAQLKLTAATGYSVKINRCSASLAPKASCQITISFSNRNMYNGQYFTDLVINDDNSIQLAAQIDGLIDPNTSGTAVLSLSLNRSFTPVGDDPSRVLTIKNTGTGVASNVSLNIPPEYLIKINRCSTTLKPNASCAVTVMLKDYRISAPVPETNIQVTAVSPNLQTVTQTIKPKTGDIVVATSYNGEISFANLTGRIDPENGAEILAQNLTDGKYLGSPASTKISLLQIYPAFGWKWKAGVNVNTFRSLVPECNSFKFSQVRCSSAFSPLTVPSDWITSQIEETPKNFSIRSQGLIRGTLSYGYEGELQSKHYPSTTNPDEIYVEEMGVSISRNSDPNKKIIIDFIPEAFNEPNVTAFFQFYVDSLNPFSIGSDYSDYCSITGSSLHGFHCEMTYAQFINGNVVSSNMGLYDGTVTMPIDYTSGYAEQGAIPVRVSVGYNYVASYYLYQDVGGEDQPSYSEVNVTSIANQIVFTAADLTAWELQIANHVCKIDSQGVNLTPTSCVVQNNNIYVFLDRDQFADNPAFSIHRTLGN